MKTEMYGDLCVIGMRGCEKFTETIDNYLKEWRGTDKSFVLEAHCPRFGTGEGKGYLDASVRGCDVYIVCDVFNYGVTYKMYGQQVPMSPDDHFADVKRVIGAIGGKARRINVIMPMLYEGRQHRRSSRESLDCAMMLEELVALGVSNITTFDAHDPRVSNAIPLEGFDNIQCTYQMLKSFLRNTPDLVLNKDHVVIVSPDEGGMSRCMYYSSVLKLDLGMFYKRRDYSTIVDGRNPIIAHEYLGNSVEGKDVIIVDDMISSGDSVIEVGRDLKKRGAKRVFVFATFGLFCAGLERIDKAFEAGYIDRIFTTNLIYQPEELLGREWYCSVNLCKYVALYIDTLNHDESISNILDPATKIHAFIDRMVAEGKISL